MKLIIQIPCFNEADTLPQVIKDLPKNIIGVDTIELLVVDDGSTDDTVKIAEELGVDHIIINTSNQGLARTFHTGIEECLRLNADIIVNTDGDNQYQGHDIPKLVAPILAGKADIVIGDRGGIENPHFSLFKRCLQVFGSFVIRKVTGLEITDAVSGFRAMSKKSVQKINIISDFSYTIEMLLLASANKMCVKSVKIGTNPNTRKSRLFTSVPQFLNKSVTTLFRVYTMYQPFRVFLGTGVIILFIGIVPILRFLYFYSTGDGSGHIQSLILGTTLVIMGVIILVLGIIADLISINRKLIEKTIHKVEKLEDRFRGNPSPSSKDNVLEYNKVMKKGTNNDV
ncbi:glycosyltransferase family 2 protein [Thalassotalea sp. HSM 43]|uniref:glycosyltransferase family 2 protein n=1 Tax=Thalassotalea sp. HSM 43 TaxID=2552945 RepID=UPI0010820600|nr:glycosyltransferase family 2 protein [Thalassotalea sp. HSM 43]QBY03454.1 glycosyltransferase family 2 protein [Thalassotalea sp. HSM 43]